MKEEKNKLRISIMAYLKLMYALFFRILDVLYTIYIIYFSFTASRLPMINVSKIVSLVAVSLLLSMEKVPEAIRNK